VRLSLIHRSLTCATLSCKQSSDRERDDRSTRQLEAPTSYGLSGSLIYENHDLGIIECQTNAYSAFPLITVRVILSVRWLIVSFDRSVSFQRSVSRQRPGYGAAFAGPTTKPPFVIRACTQGDCSLNEVPQRSLFVVTAVGAVKDTFRNNVS